MGVPTPSSNPPLYIYTYARGAALAGGVSDPSPPARSLPAVRPLRGPHNPPPPEGVGGFQGLQQFPNL